MPSRSKKLKVCVFGDSHIGCVKNALNEGLFQTPKSMQIEFWGAAGPMFRELVYADGEIIPNQSALPAVLAINDRKRDTLKPDDFDVILFMAARVRSLKIFEPELHRMQQPDGFLSEAVFFQTCKDWLQRQKFYMIASDFARRSGCKILFAPTTFLSEGLTDPNYPDCMAPNAAGRDRIWDALERIAAEDGIILIRQPAETCGHGCSTKPEFSQRDADGVIDPVHRSPEYGAMILNRMVHDLSISP